MITRSNLQKGQIRDNAILSAALAFQQTTLPEAATGRLYAAVLIARLVGIHVSQLRSEKSQ